MTNPQIALVCYAVLSGIAMYTLRRIVGMGRVYSLACALLVEVSLLIGLLVI